MINLKLDVGCGSEIVHMPLRKIDVVYIDLLVTDFNKPLLDVRCDANKLPFRAKTFTLTYCSHTLEHVQEPLTLLQEIRRVTKNTVIIKVPSLKGMFWTESSDHIYTWSKTSLKNLLTRVFDEVEILESNRIHEYLRKLPLWRRTIINIGNILFKDELTAFCKIRRKSSEYSNS